MYADDMHLTLSSNDITNLEQGLNEDLAKVNEWLIANKLTCNNIFSLFFPKYFESGYNSINSKCTDLNMNMID